ncbi:hypothetical protein AMJ83_04185 [candidate division WOR_3 bacterium SM23_42]|uniref:ComEC/Rec2-related protein domain-containing protein n=1 Tax=candidate division WOR_3 bacterium SM23_42 TaxID=1703779 RepID=A0A0S8FTE6_UNCW3|nr:MAG: hypothetical protein AMJ83_04185 [candidate division WOR_3 bacterium SM23_42]
MSIVFGTLLQSVLNVPIFYYVAASGVALVVSFWNRRFLYVLIMMMAAVNMDLRLPGGIDIGERDLQYSGIVIGEDYHEHYTRLLLHVDRVVVRTDTMHFDLPVEYYARQQAVLLGKRLTIRGRIRSSRYAHRPYILSGDIIAFRSHRHLFSAVLNPVRKYIDDSLRELFDDEHYRIASGLTLGGSGRLDGELKEVFSRAGILHILAVSGLHVGFVSLFLGLILLFTPLDHRLKFLIVMCGLVLYAGVTGFRPSVCRATLMAFLLGLALVLQRNINHIHVINITGIVFLVANPLLIFDVGAQFSFAAVYGILYLYPKIEERIIRKVHQRFIRILLTPMAVSLSAQTFVAPFAIYYFHRLPTLAVFTNLIIVPVASIIIVLLFISFLTGLVCFTFAKIIVVPASLLIAFLIGLSKFFASIPFSAINLTVSPVVLIPFYLMIWKKIRKLVLFVLLAIILILSLASSINHLTVRIAAKGVLITMPDGRNILVSRQTSLAQRIFLEKQGITELDYLVSPSMAYAIRHKHITFPERMNFRRLNYGDTEIYVADRVVITFRTDKIEFDWDDLTKISRDGRITYIISNGEEQQVLRGSLYSSIVEQTVLDIRIVLARLSTIF